MSRDGTVKTTRAPRATSGSIQMSPPWASTKALAMARPRPALPPPPFWLNISKTRSRSSRAMPGPSSLTAISTRVAALPGAVRAATRMTLSSGESRSAFSSTFARTWLMRT